MTRTLPLFSILGVFVAFGLSIAAAMSNAGWVFEYPLDDVYIHLAMAEQLAAGGYGVNAGEFASAASSPLYPVLLLPFAGTDLQAWLPLLWNLFGMGLAAWFWGRILILAGYTEDGLKPIGLIAALLGPIALNMFGVAFTGMEHSLHTAASLAVIYGLLKLVKTDAMNIALLAGVFFASAMRLEGLALGLLAAVVVLRQKGLMPSLLTAVLSLLPVLIFVGALTSIGLDPLPESVQAKLVGEEDVNMPLMERVMGTHILNRQVPAGLMLHLTSIAVLLVTVIQLSQKKSAYLATASIGVAVFFACQAHLMFGQIGWMDRYEGYIWAVTAAGLMIVASGAQKWLPALAAIGVIAAGTVVYVNTWTHGFPWNIRAIYLQPHQSARFAQDYAQVNVAVNDLGLVAWQNENYVLDLWGLASAEARHIRQNAPVQGWAEPLTQRHDVPLAMIYDSWLTKAIGEDWVKLGELRLVISAGFLGDDHVSYYATSPEHVAPLLAALQDWVPTLPDGAYFEYDPGVE